MNVKANVMNGKTVLRSIVCDVAMPTDPAILKALAEDAFTIAAQSRMRALGDPERKDGRLTDAAIAAELAKWATSYRPGARGPRDPVKAKAKLVAQIARLSDAEKIELGLMAAPATTLVKSKRA